MNECSDNMSWFIVVRSLVLTAFLKFLTLLLQLAIGLIMTFTETIITFDLRNINLSLLVLVIRLLSLLFIVLTIPSFATILLISWCSSDQCSCFSDRGVNGSLSFMLKQCFSNGMSQIWRRILVGAKLSRYVTRSPSNSFIHQFSLISYKASYIGSIVLHFVILKTCACPSNSDFSRRWIQANFHDIPHLMIFGDIPKMLNGLNTKSLINIGCC